GERMGPWQAVAGTPPGAPAPPPGSGHRPARSPPEDLPRPAAPHRGPGPLPLRHPAALAAGSLAAAPAGAEDRRPCHKVGLLGARGEVFGAAGRAKLVEELHGSQREKMATFPAKS